MLLLSMVSQAHGISIFKPYHLIKENDKEYRHFSILLTSFPTSKYTEFPLAFLNSLYGGIKTQVYGYLFAFPSVHDSLRVYSSCLPYPITAEITLSIWRINSENLLCRSDNFYSQYD